MLILLWVKCMEKMTSWQCLQIYFLIFADSLVCVAVILWKHKGARCLFFFACRAECTFLLDSFHFAASLSWWFELLLGKKKKCTSLEFFRLEQGKKYSVGHRKPSLFCKRGCFSFTSIGIRGIIAGIQIKLLLSVLFWTARLKIIDPRKQRTNRQEEKLYS